MSQDDHITIDELFARKRAVCDRLSAASDARRMLDQFEVVVRYLLSRIPDSELKGRTPGGLYLP